MAETCCLSNNLLYVRQVDGACSLAVLYSTGQHLIMPLFMLPAVERVTYGVRIWSAGGTILKIVRKISRRHFVHHKSNKTRKENYVMVN